MKLKIIIAALMLWLGMNSGFTKNVEQDENILFHILNAEFMVQAQNYFGAYEEYKKILEYIEDPVVVERAYKIAIAGKNSQHIEDAAQRYIALKPKDEKANYKYLLVLVELGERRKAREQLEKIISHNFFHQKGALLRFFHSMAFVRNRGLAETIAKETVAKLGESAKNLYSLAVFYQLRKRYDDALDTVNRSIAKDSSFADSSILKVRILLAKNEKDAALAVMEKYYNRHFSEKTGKMYAQLLFENKRYEKSAEIYRKLLENNKDKTELLDGLGVVLVNLKRYDEAYAVYNKLTASNEHAYKARYLLGLIDMEKSRKKQAIEHLSRVSGVSPYYYDAQISLAELLGEDDLARGMKILDSLSVKDEKQQLEISFAKALLYERHKKYQQAYDIYTAEAKQLETSGVFNADIYYSRALVLEKMNKIDLMERDFLRIIKEEPQNYEALNALGYVLADRTARYQEALDYIKKALELEPSKFYILDSMGWVKYKLGMHDEAISYLLKAYKIRADVEVAAHLAEVFWHKGDKNEARKYLESATAINSSHPAVIKIRRSIGE